MYRLTLAAALAFAAATLAAWICLDRFPWREWWIAAEMLVALHMAVYVLWLALRD